MLLRNCNVGDINLGTSWIYDDYSVNVHDATTTTTGTTTVTQGKLEGLALTSATLSGSNYFLGNDEGDVRTDKLTISCWFKSASSGGEVLIASDDVTTNRNYSMYITAGDVLKGEVFISGSDNAATGTTDVADDKWHHGVLTADGTNVKIYVDGVLENSGSASGNVDDDAVGFSMGAYANAASKLTGSMRDVRYYGYALSADQVSSLYSGSYNVTPLRWYKMDEAATGNATDSGPTASTASSSGSVARGHGTLDLDSTLTIAANGTLSAPRGTLDMGGVDEHFNNSGTYTHNNGRFILSGGTKEINNDGGTSNTVFYELYFSASSGSRTTLYDSMTVEKELRITSGLVTSRMTAGILTMGTATSAGKINTTVTTDGNNGLSFRDRGYVYAANQLFPYTVEGNEWALDESALATSGGLHLKWADFQYALVTDSGQGANHPTITLDGDCEFDGVTVSRGDTLDLNGQHVVFGDNLLIMGTDGSLGHLDFGDGAIVKCNADFKCNDADANITYGTGSVLWMV